jgi:hypothetical protein
MESVPFGDFDRQEDFYHFMKQAKSFESQNFVLEFNTSDARCAFNVGAEGFKSLLAARSKVITSRAVACVEGIDLPVLTHECRKELYTPTRDGCKPTSPGVTRPNQRTAISGKQKRSPILLK